jgi:UDP-glucose 4-epimerase
VSEIAVTGSEGFIGRAVCKELSKRGFTPMHVDRALGMDVRGASARDFIVDRAEGVIHLAGILGTAELFEQPQEAVDINVNGTINVLRACAVNKTPYVGITMPQVWDNVYQATKLAAMKMAAAWHRHYDVPVAHVRAFNVYGPGQKVGSPQKIIPTFSDQAWRHKPIPVWGDGSQVVDLIHVDRVAEMLVDVLRYGDNRVFDAGTARPVTVRYTAEKINELCGQEPNFIEYLPMRKGEHGKGVYARGDGWELLGYRPPFELDRLQETVESYRQ